MGWNLGIMAGGAADGYRKQSEEMRKQADQKRQDEAAKRDADYQKELESLSTPDAAYRAKLAEHEAKNKTQAGTANTAASVIAAQGAAPAAPVYQAQPPRTFTESIEQSRVLPSDKSPLPAERGIASAINTAINAPAQPEAAPAPPGLSDTLGYISKRAEIDMKYGKLNGAGMMQLMHATKQLEEEGVKGALLKFHSGDIQGGLAEFNQSGKRRVKVIGAKPAEVDVGGMKLPTTMITIEDEQGNRQTINPAQTLHSMMTMEKQLDQAARAATTKHQGDTLAETKRNHIATEGIARTKAAEGSEATTAEIKNARVFFPELYAKKPADALSAFKDLTNGEKDASAVRMKLNAIYSDSMKGGWPKEAGKSQQERDAFLEKRVNYFTAQSAPPPEKREIGKAYLTPRGMMVWRGNGWSAN